MTGYDRCNLIVANCVPEAYWASKMETVIALALLNRMVRLCYLISAQVGSAQH